MMNLNDIKQERDKRSQKAGDAQRKAMQPHASALVGASAGTGKTYVLTRRFLRTLLEDEQTHPSDILAVTYTKAAATEMRNRLTTELLSWAVMSDEKLYQALVKLLEREPKQTELHRARALFPMVLDDPLGMRVTTIHSFCQSLLAQFPLEAGLPAGFGIIEGRDAKDLLQQSVSAMYVEAATPADNAPYGWAFGYLSSMLGDKTLGEVFGKFVEQRRRFQRLLDRYNTLDNLLYNLAEALGFDAPPQSPKVHQELCNKHLANLQRQRGWLNEFADALGECTTKQAPKTMAAIRTFTQASDLFSQQQGLKMLQREFLTAANTPKKAVVSAKIKKAYPDFVEQVYSFQELLIAQLEEINSLDTFLKTAAFLVLADKVLYHYKDSKTTQGLVDFEDLVRQTLELLRGGDGRTLWVRYKMDGRISHVMLDEAQDTDSDQWDILRHLIDDFFTGSGQHQGTLPRTFFAVGDTKQAIYRFRGAERHVFDGMLTEVSTMATAINHEVRSVDLNTSFRSSDAILDVVDSIFKAENHRYAVDGKTEPLQHIAQKIGAGGRIEVWPLYEKEPTDKTAEDNNKWRLPIVNEDDNQELHQRERLHKDIAQHLKMLLTEERPILSETGKPLQAGDVLVLCRARTHMQTFIQALADQGITATQSGEMVLDEHPAIADILAVLRFLANPSDSLSLVHGVRSPLFGIDDNGLEEWRKSIKDGNSYWAALYGMLDEPYVSIASIIKTLLQTVDIATPHQTILKILDTTNGRSKLAYSYTGDTTGAAAQAQGEAIDGLLDAALDYGRNNNASLTGFLNWFDRGGLSIKLEAAPNPNAVRVMTAHGSKGLEAPMVIIPDAAGAFYRQSNREQQLWQIDPITNEDTLFLYGLTSENRTELQQQLLDAEKQRVFEDEMRLLYVALTRACERLIIGGVGTSKKDKSAPESWYDILLNQIEGQPNWWLDKETGKLIYEKPALFIEQQGEELISSPLLDTPLPEWINQPADKESVTDNFVATMFADDKIDRSKDLLAPITHDKYRRGVLVHRLLEVLPFKDKAERSKSGNAFLKHVAADLDDTIRQQLLKEACAVIDAHPFLYNDSTHTEVELAASVNGKQISGGRVDCLNVTDKEVTIIDYKTNGVVPKVMPASYRKQLAFYKDAATCIWPNRKIKCAIIWTATTPPQLEWLTLE